MMSATEPSDFIQRLQKIGCPLVLILNCPVQDFDGSVVYLDNYQAGYIAARHLIELGHKDIAYLSGATNPIVSNTRHNGICSALNNYNLVSGNVVFPGNSTLECGRKAAEQYLACKDSLPSALICYNDLMAIGFIDECRKNNIHVPEVVSVIGFDDISVASLEGIALTTMRQPTVEMTKKAIDLLHQKIINPFFSCERIIMDPTLVIRKTTIAPEQTAVFEPGLQTG
ncbi:MAG: substrate-binding domain-containing protein [Oscillospiraceae bacterium]|nr:substrate-binding domain-containing protein [Oscillospiraceae bacterium]